MKSANSLIRRSALVSVLASGMFAISGAVRAAEGYNDMNTMTSYSDNAHDRENAAAMLVTLRASALVSKAAYRTTAAHTPTAVASGARLGNVHIVTSDVKRRR